MTKRWRSQPFVSVQYMDQSETLTEVAHASSTIRLSFENTKTELVQNDQAKYQISRIFVSKSVILVLCRQLQSAIEGISVSN